MLRGFTRAPNKGVNLVLNFLNRGRFRKRKKSYVKPSLTWLGLQPANLAVSVMLCPVAAISQTVVYEKACENADPARRGGEEGSRNPFSPRPRSNDEFREAAPVFAAPRTPPVPASTRHQQKAARLGQVQAATPAEAGLPYDFFRFLKRPLLRDKAQRPPTSHNPLATPSDAPCRPVSARP